MVMDWNQYHKEIGGRVGELASFRLTRFAGTRR